MKFSSIYSFKTTKKKKIPFNKNSKNDSYKRMRKRQKKKRAKEKYVKDENNFPNKKKNLIKKNIRKNCNGRAL